MYCQGIVIDEWSRGHWEDCDLPKYKTNKGHEGAGQNCLVDPKNVSESK